MKGRVLVEMMLASLLAIKIVAVLFNRRNCGNPDRTMGKSPRA